MANSTKRTIKFLSICKDRKIVKEIIKSSDSTIIKSICNAAVNATTGETVISDSNKRLFHSHLESFQLLTSRSISLRHKSNYIISNRKKVLTLIPILLACVLNSIGTTFCVENGIIQKVHSDAKKRSRPSERKENS